MQPEIYLLGQAFDSIQFNYQHNYGSDKVIDTFDGQYNKGMLHSLQLIVKYSHEYQVDPVWLLVACFERYRFLNRKRKYLPIMRIGQLNPEHIQMSYQSLIKYSDKANDGINILYYPYLNFFLRAVKEFTNRKGSLDGLQEFIQKKEDSYLTQPYYFDKDLEKLRKDFISMKYLTWDYMLLLDGAVSYDPIIFIQCYKPALALMRHSNPKEINYYYYGIKHAQKHGISPHELLYYERSYDYLSKRGYVI